MKKSKLLLFGLVAFLASCDKDDDNEQSAEPAEPVVAKVTYVDVEPDVDLQSITSYMPSSEADCGDIGVPEEGEQTYDLDVNVDGLIDYTIKVHHYLNTPNDCSMPMSCTTTASKVEIFSKYEIYKVAREWGHYEKIEMFPHNTSIADQQVHWADDAVIYANNLCPEESNYVFSDGHILLQMDNSYGYIQVKNNGNNGIIIMSYAAGLPYEEILTGQKE